jgi:ATP-dependent DNA helicase RecG
METWHMPMPMPALGKVVLNAVVYRDYASGVPVQISVYPDKLMIWNHGHLPPAWIVEKLLGKQASVPFDPDLASVFFRTGMIESWGRGIERILQACRDAGTPPSEVTYEPGGRWVMFHYLSPHQVRLEAGEVIGEVKVLFGVLKGEVSRAQIQSRLKLAHGDHFRQTYLLLGMQAGWVEMTFSGKPTSRLQKYRPTAKGQLLQLALQ